MEKKTGEKETRIDSNFAKSPRNMGFNTGRIKYTMFSKFYHSERKTFRST